MYQIQTDNVYEHFCANKQLFNFSRSGKESQFHNDENKKAIGKMKDKLNGEIIENFVGLRTKMYSLKTKKKEMKNTNGVTNNLFKKDKNTMQTI